MSRTRAKFTQADVARAVRATKQGGGGTVELRPADGTILINVSGEKKEIHVEPEAEVVL